MGLNSELIDLQLLHSCFAWLNSVQYQFMETGWIQATT